MTGTKFKPWELVLISFSSLVVAVAIFFILSGKNIYPALVGLKDGLNQGKPIGTLQAEQGEVKRQPIESANFKTVHKGESLLNEDMLITGSDSGATVQLEDGATITLGANTMARLSFDDQLGLGGISRNANIAIVAGHVTATTKNSVIVLKSPKGETVTIAKNATQQIQVENIPIIKPKPKVQEVLKEAIQETKATRAEVAEPIPTVAVASPSSTPVAPVELEDVTAVILSPTAHQKLEIAPDSNFSFPLDVKIEVSSDSVATLISIKRKSGKKPVFTKTSNPVNHLIAENVNLTFPGVYVLELARADGKPWDAQKSSSTVEFTLLDEVKGITLNPILLGGRPIEEAKTDEKLLKNFEIGLSWKPLTTVTEYEVTIANAQKSKILLKKKVAAPSFTLSKGQVYTGAFQYQVVARGPNGLKIVSKWDQFEFTLKTPVTTSPEKKATLPAGEPVLMVWSKVSFAQTYELEIFADEELKRSLLKQQVSNNFLSVKNLKQGTYYWRVKALTPTASSAYSAANTFTIE